MKKNGFLLALAAALLLVACGDDSSSGPEGNGSEELSSVEGSSDAGSSAGGTSDEGSSQGGTSQDSGSSVEGSSEGGSSEGGSSGEASSSEELSSDSGDLVWIPVPLQSEITKALPMTGLVLWPDNDKLSSYKNSIALEYSYCWPNKVVKGRNADGSIKYDWSWFESLLNDVKSRDHQAVVRFVYEYPNNTEVGGKSNKGLTAVPDYIKKLDGYEETYSANPGGDGPTWYADWSHDSLKAFTLRFYAEFARLYDKDPRIAFLEVGFGHWSEYHISGTTLQLGKNFPDKNFQEKFFHHLDTAFKSLPWMISIDAAETNRTPILEKAKLKNMAFGLFDDSFMHEGHEIGSSDGYNEERWNDFRYAERWQISPNGGEISYFEDDDQLNFLNASGMYGVTWEQAAAKYHITFMIANDAPEGRIGTAARFLEASKTTGYRFRVTSFESAGTKARATVKNEGVAPIYRDAYIAVNGTRASKSLKGLLPDSSLTVTIPVSNDNLELTIESDYLVGRPIEYNAELR